MRLNNKKNNVKIKVLIKLTIKKKKNRLLTRERLGPELLSACLIAEVCHDSNVLRIRKEPLSITCELSKSMECPNVQACFAMFEPLALMMAEDSSYVVSFLFQNIGQIHSHSTSRNRQREFYILHLITLKFDSRSEFRGKEIFVAKS